MKRRIARKVRSATIQHRQRTRQAAYNTFIRRAWRGTLLTRGQRRRELLRESETFAF